MKKILNAEYKEDLVRQFEEYLESLLGDSEYTGNFSIIVEKVED